MPDSILVAEDERASGEYLKLLLEEMGFEVRLTGNGVEALLALEAGAFDLVITDLRMPSMDGFELLTHLGQRWPDLPAIVLTANEDVSDVIDAIQFSIINENDSYLEWREVNNPLKVCYLVCYLIK